MSIPIKEFKDIADSTGPIAFWTARAIVARFYCSKLALADICTKNCLQLCKVPLARICGNLDQVTNAAAIITWRSKNEAAKMIETARSDAKHAPAAKKPLIFNQVQPKDNPFEALLDTL